MPKKRKKVENLEKEEILIQRFPYRCPYCDEVISYDSIELKTGENEIECLFCKKKFIKIIE